MRPVPECHSADVKLQIVRRFLVGFETSFLLPSLYNYVPLLRFFYVNYIFFFVFCYPRLSYRVQNYQAKKAYLTSSARILVLEARDILDYALVLLEPPPPDMLEFGPSAAPPPPGAEGQEIQVKSTWYVFA